MQEILLDGILRPLALNIFRSPKRTIHPPLVALLSTSRSLADSSTWPCNLWPVHRRPRATRTLWFPVGRTSRRRNRSQRLVELKSKSTNTGIAIFYVRFISTIKAAM